MFVATKTLETDRYAHRSPRGRRQTLSGLHEKPHQGVTVLHAAHPQNKKPLSWPFPGAQGYLQSYSKSRPGGIRTPNSRIKSPLLYQVELRAYRGHRRPVHRNCNLVVHTGARQVRTRANMPRTIRPIPPGFHRQDGIAVPTRTPRRRDEEPEDDLFFLHPDARRDCSG